MNESEELYLLRFRYGRAAEMQSAYKVFRHKQVNIGDKNYCQTEESVRQISYTLLVVFYSFIHSMFDKSGTDFISVSEPYVNLLSKDGNKIRNELIDVWEKYKIPISKLRHNIGFHGGQKVKSHEVGYGAMADIHPQTAEFIMNHLALFFLELDTVIPPNENYNIHINREEVKMNLLAKAEKLKNEINSNAYNEKVDFINKNFK